VPLPRTFATSRGEAVHSARVGHGGCAVVERRENISRHTLVERLCRNRTRQGTRRLSWGVRGRAINARAHPGSERGRRMISRRIVGFRFRIPNISRTRKQLRAPMRLLRVAIQRPEHQAPLSPAHRPPHSPQLERMGFDEVSCPVWALRCGLSLRAFNEIVERVEVLVTQRLEEAVTHPPAGGWLAAARAPAERSPPRRRLSARGRRDAHR
jgi:hypothetical protein